MRERERLRRSLSPSASRAPLGEQTDERGPEELAPTASLSTFPGRRGVSSWWRSLMGCSVSPSLG